jgi:hypothetical protein
MLLTLDDSGEAYLSQLSGIEDIEAALTSSKRFFFRFIGLILDLIGGGALLSSEGYTFKERLSFALATDGGAGKKSSTAGGSTDADGLAFARCFFVLSTEGGSSCSARFS